MRELSKMFCIWFFLLLSTFLLAAHTENGQDIVKGMYEPSGKMHFFVTPSGTGTCTGWSDACSFRTAVSLTNSNRMDVIHVGAGDHDLDNGSDGNGTTISTDHVTVYGMDGTGVRSTKFYNGDASAAKVLTLTGDNISVNGVFFSNIGQTDPNVTLLNVQGDYCGVNKCLFVQAPPAASGTGILFDNTTSKHVVEDNILLGLIDHAIRLNSAQQINIINTAMRQSGVGLAIDGATDSNVLVQDCSIADNTLGVRLDNTSGTSITFLESHLRGNTTNTDDDCDWGEVNYDEVYVSGLYDVVYPLTTATTCSTGDGAWVWTAAATTIIPASTVTEPFIVNRINVTDANAAQVYKLELLYGEATADQSAGIFEFYTDKSADVEIDLREVIPANSIVGVKLMSSTAGVDDLDITLSYQEF